MIQFLRARFLGIVLAFAVVLGVAPGLSTGLARVTLGSTGVASAMVQSSSTSLVGHYGRIAPPAKRQLRTGTRPTNSRPSFRPPFRVPAPAEFAQAKSRANSGLAQRENGLPPLAPRDAAPANEQILAQLPGMSYEGENGPPLNLTDQVGLWPPDTQLAVGPNDVVESVNSTLSIWTKSGVQESYGDLNAFWISPGDSGTFMAFSPRLMYDASSGLWFATSMASDSANNSRTYVAASQSPDPGGFWWIYTIGSNNSGVLYQQPRLGLNDNNVVLTWDDYTAGTFVGSETWVFDKQEIITGCCDNGTLPPMSWNTGPDATRFAIVPSQSLSPTTTEYLVYNNSHPLPGNTELSPAIGVIAITGSPLTTINSTEVDVGISSGTVVPPDALQPAPGPSIATNDDRLLSAVWSNNTLWTGGNDQCFPDTTARSCLRLFDINTVSTPVLTQSFDLGVANTYLYDPAITVDSVGDAFYSFSESSTTQYGSAATAVLPAGGSFSSVSVPAVTLSGLGVSDVCEPSCTGSPNNNNSWGDYSASSPDPSNGGVVWVAAEFAASATDTNDWGTGVAEVALGPSTPLPTATVTPSATPSPTATNTSTASVTPTVTVTPSDSATATQTSTETTTETTTLTPTPSETPTVTASATTTSSSSETPTNTETPLQSPTTTATSTMSATFTDTGTPTATETSTVSQTSTATTTATITETATSTESATGTETPTSSPTSTSTASPTQTTVETISPTPVVPSATTTPSATLTATPPVITLTPGVPTVISTRVGASDVTLSIPSNEDIASIEVELATTPVAITPSDPSYHLTFSASVVVIARDVDNNPVTTLESPITISMTYRPQGLAPGLARIYTIDPVTGQAQPLLTAIQSLGFGSYQATAETSHLSPFEVLAPTGPQIAEAYLPIASISSAPPGW